MERELTLVTLTLAACGTSVLLAGAVPLVPVRVRDARGLERALLARVRRPTLVALVVFAILLGWGLQEPDITPETVNPAIHVIAAIIAAIWLRALARAVFSALGAKRVTGVARTVGLLKPQALVDRTFASMLAHDELAAVLAHEQAHVRHRDPLRIWFAQLLADMQWPLPQSRSRLAAWRAALELARDDEARDEGVAGEDLASALIQAARFAVASPPAAASLADEPLLAQRIARLLSDREPGAGGPASWRLPTVLAACVFSAVMVGQFVGEPLVRLLGGIQH